MFDLWTIEHFINGVAVAGLAAIITERIYKKTESNTDVKKITVFLVVLILSLFWECFEHYVEAGLLQGNAGDKVTYWFQGVEHWSNRLIGDTLAVLLGWYLYTVKKSLAIPAKIISLVWMAFHIFVFPDSMYLHRLLFG
jgi:hypothetical protein